MCGEAEVRVFWDLNRCGCSVAEVEEVQTSRIVPNIVHALRSSGFSGPVSIQAYGNTRALSHQRFFQSLLATGVDLHHVPGAMKDLSNHLLLDLLLWVKENPPPAHMLLISGDKEYSSVMHKLHMRGYNILLAHPEGDISTDLLSAASRVWAWDSMMKGRELVAMTYESDALPKIANLLLSKRVLTRSFNHNEPHFSSSQDVQAELDVKSDYFSHNSKMRPQNIPKEVVKQVVDVIRLRPSGFTLGAFRRQLGRSNVVLDKDFYGHKDLLSFLLSVPKLKASLVWTSDKTRTYLFTEDLTGSTGVDNDNEGTLSARCDCSKEFRSQKHEMLQVEEEAKPHVGTRVESVLAFQQLDNRSANKEHSKESITEKATGNAAKSPGIVADGKNAFSIAWRKTLSKFSCMTKFLQFVGLKGARTEMAISETLRACKGIESKLKNQHVDTEACIGSMTSQTLKEEGKQKTSAQKVSSKETLKGAMPKGVMHDDVKACIDCTTSDSAHENREISVKQSEVLEIGLEQCFPKGESQSKLQGQERELQNAVDNMSLFLQAGEYAILKEALKETGLENQLCEDILFHLLNEGRRPLFTRATTMDDVLKFLMESNLEGIAELRHEELVQLAKIFHDRIVMQIQNDTVCSMQSKATDNESFIRASTVILNKFDCENHMGGSKVLSSDKILLSEKQDLHKDTSKANEDGSMMSSSDKIDLYKADIILRDLKEMLLDSKSGVRLGSLKPLFKKRYGYELNHKALGHPSLSSLISSMEDIMLLTTAGRDQLILYKIQNEGDCI